MPATDVELADRMRAIMLLGPLDTLRRFDISVDSARCNVRGTLGGAGRFAAAPGFWSFLLGGPLTAFELGGDRMTGPPNLRLTESHSSGKRAEKLQ